MQENLYPSNIVRTRVHKIPLLKRFIGSLELDMYNNGLQTAMRNCAIRLKINLKIHGQSTKIKNILHTKPVVLVANHPSEIEIIALIGSLPPRTDAFIVMIADFLNIIPSFDKHIIPVYTRHSDKEHENGIKHKILTRLLRAFHPSNTYTPEEEHRKNIKSIKNAARKVRSGGLLVMFPAGKENSEKKWRPGIGHLIYNIGKIQDGYIIQSHIKGTSTLDYLRIIPGTPRILPSANVTFSNPLKISDVINKTNNPREITSYLEKRYKKWVTSLKD